MSKTQYLTDAVLAGVYRGVTYTAPTTIYVSLLTAVTDAEAGTVTETVYSGYARVASSFANLASSNGGRLISNSGVINFPQSGATSAPVTIIAFGIHDALTVGNLLNVVFIDGKTPIVADYDGSVANQLTAPAHGFVANQQVRLEAIPGASTLPTGLSENTTYFVVNQTTDDFKLSATSGGGAITLSGNGGALVIPLTPVTINPNDTPQVAQATLKLVED